jgi:hypothetical protein
VSFQRLTAQVAAKTLPLTHAKYRYFSSAATHVLRNNYARKLMVYYNESAEEMAKLLT